MKIKVSGRNLEVTDALRDAVTAKLERFGKYFKEDTEAQATLSVEKNRQILEVTIPINGSLLRVEEATEDMYTSVDRVIDKLNRQIEKHKTKLEKRYRGHDTIRFENIPDIEAAERNESRIVKTKRFAMKPMDAEEAVLQMELIGHNFFVFTNAETDDINVVYKRKDGHYGLIEPTF
ncbi:ribosome hibernation-promoting factor, HPF/YfiA family [Geosporobacter ferrireducens]|uniref:Ribosome hibernation promoting factor n=1 Tax=Geosporobacter ferrireducens TaxID=1424294 RepID=A0A1D8GGK1_9FIRM|nr:ribosome-associated translation inhibitor RaiA [Geosporobacter ferrireducens]AOT70013.1 ribosomal subunit interface protein [Geosporobacter ferrireducens]MTI53442.1 ribosome-associated translation inhibitor RaiA [Geosporobacter ferrireducens]